MAQKTIIGDVEITGTLTNNGSPVGGETKKKHLRVNSPFFPDYNFLEGDGTLDYDVTLDSVHVFTGLPKTDSAGATKKYKLCMSLNNANRTSFLDMSSTRDNANSRYEKRIRVKNENYHATHLKFMRRGDVTQVKKTKFSDDITLNTEDTVGDITLETILKWILPTNEIATAFENVDGEMLNTEAIHPNGYGSENKWNDYKRVTSAFKFSIDAGSLSNSNAGNALDFWHDMEKVGIYDVAGYYVNETGEWNEENSHIIIKNWAIDTYATQARMHKIIYVVDDYEMVKGRPHYNIVQCKFLTLKFKYDYSTQKTVLIARLQNIDL